MFLIGILGCDLQSIVASNVFPRTACEPTAPPAHLAVIDEANVGRLHIVGTLCSPDSPGLINALQPLDPWQLVSAGRERPVEVWSLVDGGRRALADSENVDGLALSPDRSRLYLGADDGRVGVAVVSTGASSWASAGRHSKPVWGVAADPTGDGFVTAGRDGWVRRWSGNPPSPVSEAKLGEESWCVGMRPDGAEVAVCQAASVKLLDADTFAQHATRGGRSEAAWSAQWSRDGAHLAVGDEQVAHIYDASGSVDDVGGQWSTVRQVAWGPSPTWFVVGTWASATRVIGTRTAAELFADDGQQGRVQAVAVSPQGTWIASAGDGGLIRIWGVE